MSDFVIIIPHNLQLYYTKIVQNGYIVGDTMEIHLKFDLFYRHMQKITQQ